MIQAPVFCPGCNEKFSAEEGSSTCPGCGIDLVDVTVTPTAELRLRETCVAGAAGLDAAGLDAMGDGEDPLELKRIGNYELEALLGRGGMARVYRATHLTLHRLCALKIINPKLVRKNPEYISLFFNEARAAAGLVHPNVVTIHNIGSATAFHYIEMELVEGESLQCFLDRKDHVGPVRAVHLMMQISSALAEAHGMDIVHRDLKPSNVLLTASGRAKLADFGLAKRVVDLDRDGSHASQLGIVGTPYFMAPELLGGANANTRSDVYAAGATLFCLLTGHPPFMSNSLKELHDLHASAPLPDFDKVCPEAPLPVRRVVQRCLEKDPADRYADARALWIDLQAVYGAVRDLETLITEALEGVSATWDGTRGEYRVTVRLQDGRTQRVMIESCMATPIAQRIVRIYSLCAPLEESYMRRALELNASIPHGAVAIQDFEGRPHFVVTQSYPRATCDAEEVRKSILSIASWADQVELYLSGTDTF